MTHLLFALFVAGLLPILVSAHGYIGQVSIDGKVYTGNKPVLTGSATTSSVIRQISDIDPVKGANNPSLSCGMNATMAASVATANPGSQILVYWVGGETGSSHWPHEVGPIMHYMAKCDGSCSSYDSTNAEWFKISELGVQSDGSTWYMANIMNGMPANVTIPSKIAPGNYLLRSELISLQLAVSMGGAEFYPGCIQLSIGGSGTGAPSSSEECKFPGGYSDSDPGIYDPNVYNRPLSYTFPGPPVAAFVGNDGSQGGTQPSGSSGGSSPIPTSGSSSSTPTSSGVPANTSSNPSSPTTTMAPPTTPSTTTSGNTTTSTSGATCYLTPRSNDQVLSKRQHSKKEVHKRRLIRRSS